MSIIHNGEVIGASCQGASTKVAACEASAYPFPARHRSTRVAEIPTRTPTSLFVPDRLDERPARVGPRFGGLQARQRDGPGCVGSPNDAFGAPPVPGDETSRSAGRCASAADHASQKPVPSLPVEAARERKDLIGERVSIPGCSANDGRAPRQSPRCSAAGKLAGQGSHTRNRRPTSDSATARALAVGRAIDQRTRSCGNTAAAGTRSQRHEAGRVILASFVTQQPIGIQLPQADKDRTTDQRGELAASGMPCRRAEPPYPCRRIS